MMTNPAYGLHLLFMVVILLYLISSSVATDQQGLLAFKHSVQDPTGVLSNWNSTSNNSTVCNWTGVTCDNRTQRVTSLSLHSYQLAGSISSAIGGLTFLENLDLHNNSFTGSVPIEIGNCSNLRNLMLSNNFLTGEIPVTVGNLKSLQTLDLSYNKVDGFIPASLGNCTGLTALTLTNNFLSGSIPSSLGNLVLLQDLLIGSNLLNGTLPIVLFNLTGTLTEVVLSENQLTGSISSAIGGLAFLAYLDLHNNSFSGSVPPEIGNCSNLKSLKLSSNLLTGKIPLTVGNLKLLQTLDLSHNKLDGFIPASLGSSNLMSVIMLSNNLLTGNIPVTVGNLKLLQTLDLSHNKLDGFIPASLGNCTNLIALTLTDNILTGSIPSSLGNLVQLQGLLIGSNLLSGIFPFVLFTLTVKLTEVVLSENQLTGPLPDYFDGFQALSTLDLSHNNFTGDIPNTLGLSKKLLSLNLAHNAFSSVLPSSLGSLPGTFAIALNLSDNFMNGSIGVLGNLSTTVSIDISRNLFTGGIDSLTRCSYLSTLDLSDNSFSGDLPGGLAKVGWELLNVSNNYLMGSVDGFTKLSPNLTSASFLPGNAGLCGLILNKPCTAASPSAAPTAGAGSNGHHQAMVRLRIILYAGSAVIVFGVFVILASWLDSVRVRSSRHLSDCVTCYGRGLQIIRLTVKDLLTATNSFDQKHVIGHGGTSTVYKGLLPFYPFIIAVKKFQDNEDGRQCLLKEAGIMSIIRHRNVVGTLGIASVPRSINVLVLEYIPNGTLNQHLHGSEVCEVSWEVRLKIAIDVATAISYLHEDTDEHLAVIHGDLKPANIFLESDFTAKVGDFGLAKLLVDDDRVHHRWEGTFGYSPPGDVYSFGIVILEMVTRRRPASLAFEDLGGSFIHWARAAFPDRLNDIVDPSLKLAEDFSSKKDAIDLFVRVGLLCTRDNPRERPTMREALEMMKTIEVNSAGDVALPEVPDRSIEELIDQPSHTSFQHAKSWGWINNDFILDSLDSALYHDSWISLFKLDMRDSRTLRAMGFDAFAILDIRRQTEERRKARNNAATPSWMTSVWRALFHRKAFRRVNPRDMRA